MYRVDVCNLVLVNLHTTLTECSHSSMLQHVLSPGCGNTTTSNHYFGNVLASGVTMCELQNLSVYKALNGYHYPFLALYPYCFTSVTSQALLGSHKKSNDSSNKHGLRKDGVCIRWTVFLEQATISSQENQTMASFKFMLKIHLFHTACD